MITESSTRTPFVLSDEDRQRFQTVGFLVFRQLFTASEMTDIEGAFMRVLNKAAAQQGYDGSKRLAVIPFIEGDAYFLQLLDDDRIMGLVEGLLGEDGLYLGSSDGNFYVGNTRWHPDGGQPDYLTIKIAFYLDSVGEGSGCLSVIPGSHHRDFNALLLRGTMSGLYDVNSPDIPGRYPLPSEPGDVVVFHHALWHSSWGGKVGRRMFTINCAANPTPGWQTQQLHGFLAKEAPRQRGQRMYSDRLIQTAGPRRMNKLRKLIELGYCDESLQPLSEDTLAYL